MKNEITKIKWQGNNSAVLNQFTIKTVSFIRYVYDTFANLQSTRLTLHFKILVMLNLKNTIFYLFVILLFGSCKDETKKSTQTSVSSEEEIAVKYAKGFEIGVFEGHKIITLKNPWPGSNRTFKYALIKNGITLPNAEKYDAVIEIPLKRIVVTSTTHIPSLESLDEINTLIGFPTLDYISSEKTRSRISDGKILEVGKNEDLNTEILLDLSPDAVIGFAVDGKPSTLTTLQKAGIPVLYNSDWTETSPLGKAEWIKFFGVLFDKEKLADSLFKTIETSYLEAKKIADAAEKTPSVISGAMFKDIWYMPQGESWGAQFIEDANGNYIWSDSKGTGSLSLNLETVLEKGHNADVWIGPGQFTSLEYLKNSSQVYTQFKAFKTGEVYSYNLKKGETGGSLYFELAPNRPDLVLKDIIKILHPELLPEHNLFFFSKLQ